MKNQVQLIAYVDRLSAGGFRDLERLLAGLLAGVFGGAHLLPFFTPIDGADAGFDPSNHTESMPYGTWDDVKALVTRSSWCPTVIVNHRRELPAFINGRPRRGVGVRLNVLTYDRGSPGARPRPSCSRSTARVPRSRSEWRRWRRARSGCCGPRSRRNRSTSTCAIPRLTPTSGRSCVSSRRPAFA